MIFSTNWIFFQKPRIKLNRVGIAPESTPSTSIVDHGIYRPAPLELGSSSAALATTSPNIEHSDTFEDVSSIL